MIFSGAQQTLPVGLTSIMAKHGTNYAVVFAAMTISALPIVIVFFAAQRYFHPRPFRRHRQMTTRFPL